MKKSIRKGVFETNSSSTHSLTIVSKEEFEKFKKGELLFDRDYECLISQEDKKKKEKEENYYEEEYENYEDWKDDNLETYAEKYKTKKGEEIVIFGKYGYDG